MSQFTQPFVGELIGDNKWRVYIPFEYHVGRYPSEIVIYVPVGFETDFASVPRIFWSLISPVDTHGKAAVVHDYCYRHGLYPKSTCDKIFREALQVLKVPKWKIFCMYWAVVLFAWRGWFRARRVTPVQSHDKLEQILK
jgi:hypothetical protein